MEKPLPSPPFIVPAPRACVRPTFTAIALDQTTRESLQLPLGINLTPFARNDLPLVDLSAKGDRMVRCRKCAGYINPFTTFTNHGRTWVCSLCRQPNEASNEYFCTLDAASGQRKDLAERPELTHASVDFIATPEFLRRAPRRPIFLLMLDVTYQSVSSGMLSNVCRGVLESLEEMMKEDAIYMGVVAFDVSVYYFSMREGSSGPRVIRAPDAVDDIRAVNDAFRLDPVELPCRLEDLIVPVRDSYDMLRRLFEELPKMFADNKSSECSFGPALAAAITLAGNSGAKVLSTLCSVPSNGDGKLKDRYKDAAKLSNEPKEYTLCASSTDWYRQRALACSNSGISIDIFVGSETVDVTTVAPLARFTSGCVYRATPANLRGIRRQVKHNLLRFTAFDAILRVRTSTGLVVPNFYGHCHIREPDLLALPIGTEDSSYSVEFEIGPNFKGNFAYVQFAIVYVNRNREKRIRVHTVQLPLRATLGRVVNSIDGIGMACFLTKMAVDLAVSMPFAQAQKKTTDRLVAALSAVKKHLAGRGTFAGAGQMLIPESMKYIPQILNGFLRCPAIGAATVRFIPPDERVTMMSAVLQSPPEAMLAYYLGWSIVAFSARYGIEQQPFYMPSCQRCIDVESALFFNTGETFVLWHGDRLHPAIQEALALPQASAPTATDLDSPLPLTPEQVAEWKARLDVIVAQQRRLTMPAFCAAVECCRRGDATYEPTLTRCMTEDDVRTLQSYSAYLKSVWEAVSVEIKTTKKTWLGTAKS